MLSHDQTISMLKLAKEGCEKCKEQLITENMPLIKSVIKRYIGKNCEYDDLFQLGSMGLLKAINNFDESFNVRFSTYAVPMIAGEVKRFLRDDGSIKVSRSAKAQFIEIKKYIEEYRTEHDCTPSIEQIAKRLNIETGDVIFAMDSNKMPISIYQNTDNADKTGGRIFLDKIKSETSGDIIDKLALKNLIANLEPRERKIILLRFFRDMTQSDIAQLFNISQVQVSRIENKVLAFLKEKLSDDV